MPRLFLALPLLALAALARAQQPPQTAPAPNPLQGPAVRETPAPATLIQRDMSGHLVRLETRPEEAALGVLDLSAEERAPADKAISDRFAKVSALLAEHTELFLKIQAARQGGGTVKELAPLMREFRDAAAPLLDHPLAEQIAATLPEAKRQEFTRVVCEYVGALVAEGPPQGQPRPEGLPPLVPGTPFPPRVEANLLLREMARALQATVQERRQRFDELIKTVDATPEQEAKLQAIIREKPTNANGLRPTAEDRESRERKIMEVLTTEQRRKLLAARREQIGR